MKIVSVIPLKKGILKGDLTYFTSLEIPEGNIVSVPVRNKNVLALVTSCSELSEAKAEIKEMSFNLKKVARDLGPSLFLKEFLETAMEVSRYFAQDHGSALSALIPSILLEGYDALAKVAAPKQPASDAKDVPMSSNVRPEKLLLQYPLKDRAALYKTIIRESFARKKSVFIVLPTEADAEKWQQELSRGIEQFVFVLYSGLTAKKILKACETIVRSTHPVLVFGTAPFLSIPREDIGTIILEHESSSAYKTIKRLHLDLRTVAEIYAARIGAKFILADELLRFETIGRIEIDHLQSLYPLSFRIDFPGAVEIIKRERKRKGEKFKIFEDACRDEMGANLKAGKNVFIFSLRKGFSTVTVCRDCGDSVLCENCGSPLVLYLSHKGKERTFVCNRCEKEKGSDTLCKTCGGWNLMPLGIGTDTVYEEIKKLFPKAKIFKLDRESVGSASGAKKVVREFEKEKGAILIGTEMAFFYLTEKVPLSVIASFETLWSIPNFRMSERILHIALRILDLTSQKVVIETKNERDPALRAVTSGNLLPFVREELKDREKLSYPPFARFIKITHVGSKDQTLEARKFLADYFREYDPEIFSGFVLRLKDKFVTNALIRLSPRSWSSPSISGGSLDGGLLQKLLSLPTNYEVRVDPEDLL